MTDPFAEIDEDAAPPEGEPAPDGGIGGLSPRVWAVAWVLTLAVAALLLLMGDGAKTPWPAIGSLALGAVAVVGGWVASRRAEPPSAPVEQGLPVGAALEAPTLAGSHADAAAQLAAFEALMGDLPELGLLMDREGRAEVVFGRPVQGVSAEALHAGLPALAAEADRPPLNLALAQAWSGGHGEAVFALAQSRERSLKLSVRRTGEGGLAGIVTAAPAAPPPPPPVVAPVVPTPAPPDSEAVAAAEAERDAALAESAGKSRFLANMSHELRTPLNAILGFSDIMRTRLFGPLPERYAEYAELIHESGRHLTDLINDVLDMSKLEADRYVLQTEVFDAKDAVGGALKLMRLQADDKGVTLRGDLPSEPLEVDADRRALKQIVLNLVSNALKFTPPEGRIDVTLRALGGQLELVVADTGEGISAEDLQRLGQPYEQTDAGRRVQGTGLGLSLVKALTALHGGEFTLESRLGEGSAATVRLPVLKGEAPADEAAISPS